MSVNSWVGILKQTFGRGMFPQEISFALDLPLRNILLSPRKLVARLALNPTSHVLEVGAGSDFYSLEVARTIFKRISRTFGLTPDMVRKAQQKLVTKGISNVGYTVADASQLSFESESFDLVFLVTVLGEIVDQKAFRHEAYRVLKRGGVLSISEHYPDPDFCRSLK
jgi:ubiquinone/menaquinone biosynthesis C-methylase UbiE